MPSRLSHVIGLARAVGTLKAVQVLLRRAAGSAAPLPVTPKGISRRRVVLRPMESDLFVASQIFGWTEYDIGSDRQNAVRMLAQTLVAQGDVPVIVDAGANVGYSALYFADTYPEAFVLAVEPDAETYRMLEQNCAGHDRIKPVHAALWSHDRGVELSGSELNSWSRLVRDGGSEHRTSSMRLDQLLAGVPHSRLLILKLDIEGAEREVCLACPDLVRTAPCILVEPHDFKFPGAACLTPLFSAIAGKQVDTLLIGENLLIVDANLARCTSASET